MPMRIGVNSGSLPKHLIDLEFENPVEALVTAATEFVDLMHRLDFDNFKVSMKSTNVPNTIASNRLLSEKIDHPLHLGITEAGTKWTGSLKTRVGLGTLLADGIGDTIRISLSTFHAEEEVKVGWEILKALKLRERGPVLIACPTCGRLQFDMDSVVAEVEQRLQAYPDPIEVSILGCAVNGIGEARHADFGITGAKDAGMIFSKGEPLKKVPTDRLVDELFAEIDRYYESGQDRGARCDGCGRGRAVARRERGSLRDDARAARRDRSREVEGLRRWRGRAVGTERHEERRRRRGELADRRAPLQPRLSLRLAAPRVASRFGEERTIVRGRCARSRRAADRNPLPRIGFNPARIRHPPESSPACSSSSVPLAPALARRSPQRRAGPRAGRGAARERPRHGIADPLGRRARLRLPRAADRSLGVPGEVAGGAILPNGAVFTPSIEAVPWLGAGPIGISARRGMPDPVVPLYATGRDADGADASWWAGAVGACHPR